MKHSSGLSVLLAALATSLCSLTIPPGAQAQGFSGAFDPNNWQIKNYLLPTPPPDYLDPQGLPTTTAITTATPFQSSYPYTAYLCNGTTLFVTCIDSPSFSPAAGTARLIGSDSDSNGFQNEEWVTHWEMTSAYTGAPYALSFNWNYSTIDTADDDSSYFYTIDGANNYTYTLLSNATIGDNGTISIPMQTGWRLGFGVTTRSNSGGPGELQITQFNPPEVPGPLALFGAAAAFGWSRRLRQRQRNSSDQLIRL